MPKEKAVELRVTVTGSQVVTYTGKSLGSVFLQDGFLVVNKKLPRSGQFTNHYIPLKDVISYSEGEGGKEGTAYATVIRHGTITDKIGLGIVEHNFVSVVDEHNVNHVFQFNANVSVAVVEQPKAEVYEEPAAPAPSKRTPKPEATTPRDVAPRRKSADAPRASSKDEF